MMIGNKNQITEYVFKGKEEQIYICYKKESKSGRTLGQNNFFYGLFSDIEKQSPFSSETIKQYILSRVFGKKEVYGELVNNKTQTSKLTTKEAADLINGIIIFCEENTLRMRYTSAEARSLYNSFN